MTVRDAIANRHLRGDRAGRNRLVAYSLRNGATYREIADIVGCSESTVHGWLKGYKHEVIGSVLDEPVPPTLVEVGS